MAYIGNAPAEAYTNTVKDTFSGNGSTVAFTLSLPTTTNNVRVVVENVIQDPTVAYSVSGTTLTFTSAPPSGTNNIYVVHLGPAVQTVQPPTELSGNFTLTGDLTQTGDYDLTGAATVSGNLTVDTNTLFVDAANNRVGVGTSSPSSRLHVSAGNGDVARIAGTTRSLYFGADSGGVMLGTGASQTGNSFYFSELSNFIYAQTNSVERMRIDSSGHMIVPAGVTLGTSAGVYNAANTLDDYEEGTWTPTSGTNSTVNSVVGDGSYVKIGSLVHAYAYFAVTTTNTAFIIGGLPFSGLGYGPATIYYNSPASFAGNAYIEISTNFINFSLSTTLSNFGVMISATYRAL